MKIGIVLANYYPDISSNLAKGIKNKLKKNNLKNYNFFYVNGIFEIPYVISKNIKKFDTFIAAGCVIIGETPHFTYLCNSVFSVLLDISISKQKPIANGILTCLNKQQARIRSDPKKKDKGGECVDALITLLKKKINENNFK